MEKWKKSSGCSKQIAFISCSKTKKKKSCPAKEMYQGTLFKKTLTYTFPKFKSIFILSAKYGLLDLETIIDPYELTLKTFSKKEKQKWANDIRKQIESKKIQTPIIVFAGKDYTEYLMDLFVCPLKGIPLGCQLKWFNDRLKPRGFNI